MFSCCTFEILKGLDTEGFVQPMHALRTKAGNRRQCSEGRRGPGLDLC